MFLETMSLCEYTYEKGLRLTEEKAALFFYLCYSKSPAFILLNVCVLIQYSLRVILYLSLLELLLYEQSCFDVILQELSTFWLIV